MTITQTSRRLALVAAAAVLAALLPFGVASAQDQDGDADITLDLEGESNDQYAVAWSRQAYPDGALADDNPDNDPTRAFIGRDDLFPDNLASGQLQDEGPLLLTPGDALSQVTADELARLGVTDVTVLGGEVAISDDVVAELEDLGLTVDRLEGITRIETAIAIADENEDNGTVLIARAFPGDADETSAWADSLAAGAWAAAADADLLLTQTEELTASTADALAAGEYDNVIIVGGPVAVSEETEAAITEINENTTRVAGDDRAATAVAIAEARGFADSAAADVTIVVDGWAENAWADGFSAANIAGINDYPVVLSNSTSDELPPATQEFLVEDGEEFAAHLTEVDAICGSSVPDADTTNDQCQQVADETGTTVSTVPFTPDVEPPVEQLCTIEGGGESVALATEPSNDDNVQYTASGLAAETDYVVSLIGSENVTVDEDGNVVFNDDNENTGAGNNEADDLGDVDADIQVANGATLADDTTTAVVTSSPDGTITFTVEGEAAEAVTPVIFTDTDGDEDLRLDANDDAEEFCVGESTNFVPAEAANGFTGATVVETVDKEADSFSGESGGMDRTFFYDANDVFQLNGAPVNLETFEANLSEGDTVAPNYANDPALVSTFNITTNTPDAPTVTATATPSTNNSFTVTVTPTTPNYAAMDDDDEFVIYRSDYDADSDGDDDGTCDAFEDGVPENPVDDDDAEYQVGDFQEVFRQTKGAEAAADGVTDMVFTYVDGGLANGCYAYFATVVVDGDESPIDSDSDGFIGDEGTAVDAQEIAVGEQSRPFITNSDLLVNGGATSEIDNGDTIVFDFNENMNASIAANGSTFRFTDADGTLFEVICNGVTVVCSLGDDGAAATAANTLDRLTVALTADPTNIGGTQPAVNPNDAQIPGTLTAVSAEWDDVAGNQVDLTTSTDIVIDDEL